VRYALTFPIYAADPREGLARSEEGLEKLEEEFLTGNGENSGCANPLDADSIATPHDLTMRVQCLKGFTSFVDDRLSSRLDSASYRANLLLAKIPVALDVEDDPDHTLVIMTATMLASKWSRAENGELVLTAMTIADD
jgi:hypothetical protein